MASGMERLAVRPVFIGWITLLMQVPLQLFFTLWCGGFFGGLAASSGLVPKGFSAAYVIGAITFIAFPLVAYVGKKLNYSRTAYRFYDDRLEFEEGFFSINKKVIRFQDIKETTLREGFLQRIYGLGSIYLATLATGTTRNANPFSALGFGNVSASGIVVRDVGEPNDVFEKVRRLVDAQNQSR